jgi:hypothetical protein
MITRLKYILIFTIIVLYSCKKDAQLRQTDFPYVLLTGIDSISSDGATVKANIINLGNQKIIDYGFVWTDSIIKPTLNSIIKSFRNNALTGEYLYRICSDLEMDKTFNVRAYIRTNKVIVYSNNCSFISKGCLPPVINNFYPDSGSAGHIITITGKNYSLKDSNNHVYFGTTKANVIKSTADTLLVQCPNTTQTFITNISIEVAQQQTQSQSNFVLICPWKRLNSVPSGQRIGSFSFIIGNKGYTASGLRGLNGFASLELYEYDSDLDHWSVRSNFSGSPRYNGTGFSINGKGYVCFGLDQKYNNLIDLWEYDPIKDNWTRKSDYPGNDLVYRGILLLNNKAYIMNVNKELWCYDPLVDNWSIIKENIGMNGLKVSIEYNGYGYILSDDGIIWKYDPNSNEIQIYYTLPVTNMFGVGLNTDFQLNNNFYFDTNPYWIGIDLQTNKTFLYYNWPFNPNNGINVLFGFRKKVCVSSTENTDFWEFYPR